MIVRPYFRWFDGWTGFYYDGKAGVLYLQAVPFFGLRIKLFEGR